ncbi:MAG: anthranilate synthase component I [Phycisphaeraceae bacterium]|nr:anthranilate synthase component I [Phycisphaeraceae bacterium]
MPWPRLEQFLQIVERESRGQSTGCAPRLAVPIALRLLDDQLTPVLAYRRLVAPDERTAPSFLLESVEGGERQGRHSILGAQPAMEVLARGNDVEIIDHRAAGRPGHTTRSHESDPLDVLRRISRHVRLVMPPLPPGPSPLLPSCFLGGWAGFAGYDTVRYAEPDKLDPRNAPPDDRHLPDMHWGYYDGVVVFDHVAKLVFVVKIVEVQAGASPDDAALFYGRAVESIEARASELQDTTRPMPSGRMEPPPATPSGTRPTPASNITPEQHAEMVARAKEYIRAGDIFQVVLGQRFERRSAADPFEVYRSLRAVNPSPYMVYMQAQGCILVASSPEILCRVRHAGGPPLRGENAPQSGAAPRVLTNRPLAGTRKRGATPEEDRSLESELLADPKERAEHIMLVDLGRNDVGRVCTPGTIQLPAVMVVERYSHVMHISSTVTGHLRPELDCWDALRATLPVGTISGAPKIRAMQIIDELEPVRRGPYGGGMGYVSLDGDMDIALALRTMVVPTAMHADGQWVYHLQAAGGIVADSEPEAEYQETVNKAAALARAIDVAEAAFRS